MCKRLYISKILASIAATVQALHGLQASVCDCKVGRQSPSADHGTEVLFRRGRTGRLKASSLSEPSEELLQEQ